MASVENVAAADGVPAAVDAAKAAQVLPEAGAVEEADAEARVREASKLVSADKRISAMVNLVRGAVAPPNPTPKRVELSGMLLPLEDCTADDLDCPGGGIGLYFFASHV